MLSFEEAVNMYVEVKSANGISIEPIETSLLAKRIIILDKK